MLKHKKILIILNIILFIILIAPISSLANTLTLNISANKEKIKIEDEIQITVSWNEKMQAADFNLNYNDKKLEYVSANIDDVFIDIQEKGKIKTAWVSVDETDKTEVTYTFKVKGGGKINLSASVEGGFANGNLETPTKYKEGKLTLKVPRSNMFKVIVTLPVIIILIILFIIKKKVK